MQIFNLCNLLLCTTVINSLAFYVWKNKKKSVNKLYLQHKHPHITNCSLLSNPCEWNSICLSFGLQHSTADISRNPSIFVQILIWIFPLQNRSCNSCESPSWCRCDSQICITCMSVCKVESTQHLRHIVYQINKHVAYRKVLKSLSNKEETKKEQIKKVVGNHKILSCYTRNVCFCCYLLTFMNLWNCFTAIIDSSKIDFHKFSIWNWQKLISIAGL